MIVIKKCQTQSCDCNTVWESIACDNWNYATDADVKFSICHDNQNIFLKFKVSESDVKALNTNYHEPVYEDSCVEFFISFDGKNYYNFEFNCIGNILAAYGDNRDTRESIDNKLLDKIVRVPSLGNQPVDIPGKVTSWDLDITIPIECFVNESIETLNGVEVSCNVYKCGDKLNTPHYLSWAAIDHPQPNFHLIDFFKTVTFE